MFLKFEKNSITYRYPLIKLIIKEIFKHKINSIFLPKFLYFFQLVYFQYRNVLKTTRFYRNSRFWPSTRYWLTELDTKMDNTRSVHYAPETRTKNFSRFAILRWLHLLCNWKVPQNYPCRQKYRFEPHEADI